MFRPQIRLHVLFLAASWAVGVTSSALSQSPAPTPPASPKESAVPHRASGSFDVSLTAHPPEAGLGHSRMSIT